MIYQRWFIITFFNIALFILLICWLAGYSGPISVHGQVLSDLEEPLPNTTVHYRIGYLVNPFTAVRLTENEITTDGSGRFSFEIDHTQITSIRIYMLNRRCTFPAQLTPKKEPPAAPSILHSEWKPVPDEPPRLVTHEGNAIPISYGWNQLFSEQNIGSQENPFAYRATACAGITESLSDPTSTPRTSGQPVVRTAEKSH